MMAKIKIGGLVLVIILAECVLAYLFLPGASQVSAMAESPANDSSSALIDPAIDAELKNDDGSTVEVDLENFGVTAYQPLSNTTLRIDFHLWATVHASEQEEFTARFNDNKHRIREQVIVTVRSSEITDLTDAGLGLIKRKILEKTNRTLGKPLLQSVIVSDFSFVEQ